MWWRKRYENSSWVVWSSFHSKNKTKKKQERDRTRLTTDSVPDSTSDCFSVQFGSWFSCTMEESIKSEGLKKRGRWKALRRRNTFRWQPGLSGYLLRLTLVKRSRAKDAATLKSNSTQWRKSKASVWLRGPHHVHTHMWLSAMKHSSQQGVDEM